ncbi:MAG: T9SS type A sorting domain-containing protein [Sphingobacteriia bacterium]|nr:T9SS type A sorting domain-containing protein [Sphingobacteriia bacterium]
MKNLEKMMLVLVLLPLLISSLNAQNIDQNTAKIVAQTFLNSRNYAIELAGVDPLINNDETELAFVAHLKPVGFVLIANSRLLEPVIAYSFESDWNIGGEEDYIFKSLVYSDLKARMDYPDLSPVKIHQREKQWNEYLTGNYQQNLYEQWPPEGSSPTGGWLRENWTQSSPYNGMCPVDLNTHQRSIAGCPAVAMAQILNCIMDIRETRLSDADDYYHNFGANNKFWIDDDWITHEFPYFDSLNLYLDTLEANYQSQKPIDNTQKAALNFACGVTLKQVYSSSISGTYGMTQAGAAYQRFGFTESRLVLSPDTLENQNLAQNMKNGWPAHLGLVDPAGTVGHNVVIDGYNTDNFFHLNFGWGGSANGWYTMPPTSIPYNLTVIEGVVLDIIGDNPYVGINNFNQNPEFDSFLYLPAQNQIIFKNKYPVNGNIYFSLINANGQIIEKQTVSANNPQNTVTFVLPKLTPGFYIANVTDNHKLICSKKLVIIN